MSAAVEIESRKEGFSPVRIGEIAVCTCIVYLCRHLKPLFIFLEKLIWPKIAIWRCEKNAMGKYVSL